MAVAFRSRLAPAVVVPDELALTMWGHDPVLLGLDPSTPPGRAEQLLVADPLPPELHAALAEIRAQMPGHVRTTTVGGPVTAEGPVPAESSEDEGEEPHDHGDHGDHGDMMAIVGEPSADGLVMEPINFRHGPLAPGLAGGLTLEVELDGDVVTACRARAQLAVQPSADTRRPLDPLAPVAWTVLIDAATEQAGALDTAPAVHWERIAALELERALGHAAWLRSMGRLLDWSTLVERAQTAITHLLRARPNVALGRPVELPEPEAVGAARQPLTELRRAATDSIALRVRLGGRGVLAPSGAPGLQGPNARASGLARDLRATDPLYGRLGFETLLESDADALARTRLRAREALQSLELAELAQQQAAAGPGSAPPQVTHEVGVTALEGPRGPLIAASGNGLEMSAPGTQAALSAAGDSAVGHEWSAALATVASFDLSPWRVPG